MHVDETSDEFSRLCVHVHVLCQMDTITDCCLACDLRSIVVVLLVNYICFVLPIRKGYPFHPEGKNIRGNLSVVFCRNNATNEQRADDCLPDSNRN